MARNPESKNLNFVIAICAVLISAASFYATFLQADSAEKQVRAMTLPLLHFEHGNYDQDLGQRVIDFTLTNAGIGPAIVHDIALIYENDRYSSLPSFLRACCEAEYSDYDSNFSTFLSTDEIDIVEGGMVSDSLRDVIVPGQSDYLFLQLYYGDLSEQFWNKLNQERWNLKLEVCYCTLLDDCFTTQGGAEITEVEYCPVE